MPEEEPQYQPPEPQPEVTAPPERSAAEELAFERGRNAALEEQLNRQPQPSVTAPPAMPQAIQVPNRPIDLLTPGERENLKLLRVQDPDAYDEQMSDLASRHAQMRLAAQAGPNLAGSVVDGFRARMAYEDAAYFKDVAPLFDAAIAALGNGIIGLATMNRAQQDSELGMRWKSAKADVMAKQMDEAKRKAKAEPPPLRGDGVTPSVQPLTAVQAVPELAVLAERYKFTPAQLEVVEAQWKRDNA